MNTNKVRSLLISDFTIDGLVPFLAAESESPSFKCEVAPFDQVMQLLLDEQADAWRLKPEIAVVWTRPQAAIKSFARLLNVEQVATDEILAEVDRFAACLCDAARRVSALFVPTWTWPGYDRVLGLLNMSTHIGPAYHLMRMNVRLAEAVAPAVNVHLVDAGRWMELAGADASNPKLWHLGKIAFGREVFKQAAADIKAGVRAIKGQSRKLVVLDLDDTLWGGIVGDVGWENLNLGGHDPLGEAFCAFQRALKALANRGIVLGIVSKNTEAVALEAIDRHPEMVLRRNDFVGWRINWDDKAQNLIDLATELNLGLEAVVFIDDSPVERARIREALPAVYVPEWPADKLLYEKALVELNCFDSVAIGEEDRARTRMYVSERSRQAARASVQSLEEYLRSLELKLIAERLSPATLQRAAQLLNKTNQLNLTTRRMTERQLTEWAEADGHQVYVFRVADRFDDYGLTGIASLEVDGDAVYVADFVMSCRVIGRGVEQGIMHVLIEHAREAGRKQLVADYAPTPLNAPCKLFFDDHSNLTRLSDGDRYVWDLLQPYPAPDHMTIQHVGEAICTASLASER
jgi:FkbH-like protein